MPKHFLYLARQLKQFSCWSVAIIAQMVIYMQGREREADLKQICKGEREREREKGAPETEGEKQT